MYRVQNPTMPVWGHDLNEQAIEQKVDLSVI